MKKLWLGVILLCFARFLGAQATTSVSATVTDSDSTVWANGSWKLDFYPNPSYPGQGSYRLANGNPLDGSVTHQSGVLDGSGSFTASVYQNTPITPVGSQWQLTVCPNAVTKCGIYIFQAIGSTLNISSGVSAIVPAPRFNAVSGAYGYTDLEASMQLIPGATYWNVSSNGQRCYSATGWGACVAASSTGTFSSIALGPNDNNTPWAGALQNSATEPVSTICIGDSICQGTGPIDNQHGWFNQLQLYGDLQIAFPGNTSNYYQNKGNFCTMAGNSSCDPAQTGTWTGVPAAIYQTTPSTFYTLFKATSSATACEAVASNTSQWVDNLTLYYYTNTDSAAWTVTVDSTPVGTFGGSSGSLLPATPVNIPITPSGTGHNICVIAPSSGYIYLWGWNLTAGTTGVRLFNLSIPGAASNAFVNDSSWATFIPTPAAAVLALGANDGWPIPPTTLTNNLGTLATMLGGKHIPVVGMITEPSNVSVPSQDASVLAVTQWYQARSIPVVSIWNRWGSYAAGNAQGLYADTIHPSTAGANDMKVAFEGQILPGMYATLVANSSPTTINMLPFQNVTWQGLGAETTLSWPGVGSFSRQVLGSGLAQDTAPNGYQLNSGGEAWYTSNAATRYGLLDLFGNFTLTGSGSAAASLNLNNTGGGSFSTYKLFELGNGVSQHEAGGYGINFCYNAASSRVCNLFYGSGNLWIGSNGSYSAPNYLLTLGSANAKGIDSSFNALLNDFQGRSIAPTGSCSGDDTGAWSFSQDGKQTWCNGSGTWQNVPVNGPTRTCNANGCYIQYSDGTFHMWGTVTVSFSSSTVGTQAITFPTSFTTLTNLALVVSPLASPSGANDAVTAYTTGVSTTGATGIIRCAENIGGSGCPVVTTTVPLAWQADGN